MTSPAPVVQARRRVALFGGSFDPVHAGHLHAARAARAAFGLDRIVFVPAAESPHKPDRRMAEGRHRLAMLERAIGGEPGWSASDIELRRGGRSYTIDTVRDLPVEIGEADDVDLYLILGSDNVPGLPSWRDAAALLDRVQPIVVHREGEPEAMFGAVRAALGAAIARKLEAGYLHLPPVVVSSTDLRARLPGLGAECLDVPSDVLDYIRAHGLYGARA